MYFSLAFDRHWKWYCTFYVCVYMFIYLYIYTFVSAADVFIDDYWRGMGGRCRLGESEG